MGQEYSARFVDTGWYEKHRRDLQLYVTQLPSCVAAGAEGYKLKVGDHDWDHDV